MRRLAGLVVILAACGDDSPVRHLDGGPTDSPTQIDGSTVQPVTLTVTIDGIGAAGVKVYFQGVDSSLISNTVTDAAGVATALMPAGGYVTAVDPYSNADLGVQVEFHDLYTFAGVKSGDHLLLKNSFGSVGTSATVTAPVDSDPNVASYLFTTPCDASVITAPGSAAQPQYTFILDSRCATTTDFLVASLDGNGAVLSWLYVPNKTVASTIDLTASTYTAATDKTYEYTNAPGFNFVDFEQSFVSARGTVITQSSTAFGKGPPFGRTVAVTPFTGALDIVHGYASANGATTHHFLDWGPFAASYSTDVGARMLPDFDTPVVDSTAHTLGWTESATGVTPDFAIASFQAGRERVPPMLNLQWEWNVVAPYGGASIPMPTLPTDIADFAVTASDFTDINGVALGKVPGGYDAVRANLFNVDGIESFATSATGSMTVAQWFQPTKARSLPQRRVPGFVTGIMRDRAITTHRDK